MIVLPMLYGKHKNGLRKSKNQTKLLTPCGFLASQVREIVIQKSWGENWQFQACIFCYTSAAKRRFSKLAKNVPERMLKTVRFAVDV